MIRILLVDDHVIFREGMKALINELSDFRVVAEVNNGHEALKMLESIPVDLVLTDIHMSEMNGFELTKHLRKAYPELKVVVLTMDSNSVYIDSFKGLGTHGYITKATDLEELKRVLVSVWNSEDSFHLAITDQEILQSEEKENCGAARLTKREKEILDLISKGLTDKEIARQLFLSPYTIIAHRKNLLSKLGLSNKVELTRYAIQNAYTLK